MKKIISLGRLTIPNTPTQEFIEASSAAGFNAVGINFMNILNECDSDLRRFSAELLKLGKELERHRLTLTHCGHLLMGNVDRRVADLIIVNAQAAGTRMSVLVAEPSAAPDDIVADYEYLVGLGEKYEVTVCVEFAMYSGLKNLRSAV